MPDKNQDGRPDDPLSAVGDIVGNMLGIPGRLLGSAGGAIADSITPEGKISVSTLLNLGGKRDKIKAAEDLKFRAAQLDIQRAEWDLQHGIQRDTTELAGAPKSTQQRVAEALGVQGMNPAAVGITPQAQAADEQAAQALAAQYSKVSGTSLEDSRRIIDTYGLEAGAKLVSDTSVAANKDKSAWARFNAAEAGRNARHKASLANSRAEAANYRRQQQEFEMTKALMHPRYDTVPGGPKDPKHPERGQKKDVRVAHQYTAEELEKARAQAREIVDKVWNIQNPGKGGPKKFSLSQSELADRANMRRSVETLMDQGLDLETAIRATDIARRGPEVALKLSPVRGKGSPGDMNIIATELADRLTMANDITAEGVMQLDIAALADKLLVDAGATPQEAIQLKKQMGAILRARGR
jgi:hypothetical protein